MECGVVWCGWCGWGGDGGGWREEEKVGVVIGVVFPPLSNTGSNPEEEDNDDKDDDEDDEVNTRSLRLSNRANAK